MASNEDEIVICKRFAQRSANMDKVNYLIVTMRDYPNNTKAIPYYMYQKSIHLLVETIIPINEEPYAGIERRK